MNPLVRARRTRVDVWGVERHQEIKTLREGGSGGGKEGRGRKEGRGEVVEGGKRGESEGGEGVKEGRG